MNLAHRVMCARYNTPTSVFVKYYSERDATIRARAVSHAIEV
jgi:hypothetical protein